MYHLFVSSMRTVGVFLIASVTGGVMVKTPAGVCEIVGSCPIIGSHFFIVVTLTN